MCQVFRDLQQRLWQEKVIAQVDYIICDALRVSSHDFRGEKAQGLAFISC
jgi:hypothetical protein